MWAQLFCANIGNMEAERERGRVRAATGWGRGWRRGAGNNDTASPLHPWAYKTALIIRFLDTHHDTEVQDGPEQPQFVVILDNVSFHRTALVRDWFTNRNRFNALNLPQYTPFLNPIEEFFSAWCWKVCDHKPHARYPLQVRSIMDMACKVIFPPCLSREDIACDVDEVMWPNAKTAPVLAKCLL